MFDDSPWSGHTLVQRLYRFIQENANLFNDLKITPVIGEGATVTFIRCQAFEKFLDLLEEKMFVAK